VRENLVEEAFDLVDRFVLAMVRARTRQAAEDEVRQRQGGLPQG
jgi:hypothetical protein